MTEGQKWEREIERENERQNGGEIRGKTERGREAEKLAL